MAVSRVLGFYPGLSQPNLYPMTFAGIQQACDDVGIGGEVYVGPGNVTGWGTLTVYGKTTLLGAGTLATLFTRDPAATGPAIREKTAGEGNASGATGIILEKFSVYGNGSVGDGIDMGNAGGANFNALASIIDVLSRDFASGNAIKLSANAIHTRNMWGLNSAVGIYLNAGGACHHSGFWAEANTDVEARIACPYNTISMCQLEHNGVVPTNGMLEFTGGPASQNHINGFYASLSGNMAPAHVINEKTGANRNTYIGIRVVTGGFTFGRTINHEAVAAGPTNTYLPFYFDSNTDYGGFYDSSDGRESKITGDIFQPYQCDVQNNLSAGGTSNFVGNVTEGVAGTGCLHTIGAGAAGADFASLRIRSGSGGGQSRVLFNQNGTDLANIFITAAATFIEQLGTLHWRNGIGGADVMTLTTAGDLQPTGAFIAKTPPTLADNTTPSVANLNVCVCSPAGATTITDFTNGTNGQEITIIFTNGNATLSDASPLFLNGGFTSSADDVITLVRRNSLWYEKSRSVN